MKKITLVLAFVAATMNVFAKEEESVNEKVLAAFQTEFITASEVSWSEGDQYYKAEFTFNEQRVHAWYNVDGELLGLSRYITSPDLPLHLQAALKKSYSQYWISDLFEVTKSNSTGYYITLQNGDTTIILKATANDDWSVYKKVKKV